MKQLNAQDWGRLATQHARRGAWALAGQAFEQVIRQAPEDRRGWEGLARARFAQQDLEAIRKLVPEMLSHFPNWSFPYVLAGHLHKACGETDLAIENYHKAIQYPPISGEALFGAIDLRVPALKDPLAQQAIQLAANTESDISDRINAGFAAAHVFDHAGQYEAAFEQLLQANTLARQDLSKQSIVYRPQQREQDINALIARYPAESFPAELSPLPIPLTPIFIVGMPRSGTTLIEQILATHPDVEAAGELTAAHECEHRFVLARGKAGHTGPIDRSNPEEIALLEDAREQYIDTLFAHNLDGPLIVDKMPANFELAGFLHLLFPEAPILHSVRDPRATGFSLFSANFGGHEPYYHDLDHLAHYYGQYQRIMGHWQAIIPDSLTSIVYEDLVSNPEQQIPALLEAVGLCPHADCLEFYRTQRPVFTASHAQVRQPLYRTKIDHWRHYENCLGPLLSL